MAISTAFSPAYKYKSRMQRKREFRASSPGIYKKFYVEELETGKRTCGITLTRGRVAIGDDVWRMSNRSDTCEYPFKLVTDLEFKLFYKEVTIMEIPVMTEDEEDDRAVI